MNTATKTQTEPKAPTKIELKLIIPYGLIVAAMVFGLGFFSGWTTHINQQADIKAAANEMVTSLSTKK